MICGRAQFKTRERLVSEDDSCARNLLASSMQAAGAVTHLELPLHSQDIAMSRSLSILASADCRCSQLDPYVGPIARPIARRGDRPTIFFDPSVISRTIQPLKMSLRLAASASPWRERAERASCTQKAHGRARVSLAAGRRQGSLGVGRGAGAVICGRTQCEEMKVVVKACSSEGIRGRHDEVRGRMALPHSCEAALSDEHVHDGRFVDDRHPQFLSLAVQIHRHVLVLAQDATRLASLLRRQDHPLRGSKAPAHSVRMSSPQPELVVIPVRPPCEARHV